MPIDRLLIHTISVVRRATAVPGTADYDTWDTPEYGAEAVVATVKGRIRPRTIREQVLAGDAGPTFAEYRGYLPTGTSVAKGDRLRKDDEDYEVRGVTPDPAGTTAYVFVELARVET